MPIWLRKFTFRKLKEHYDAIKKLQQNTTSKKKQTFGPNIQPSFTSKASKK